MPNFGVWAHGLILPGGGGGGLIYIYISTICLTVPPQVDLARPGVGGGGGGGGYHRSKLSCHRVAVS